MRFCWRAALMTLVGARWALRTTAPDARAQQAFTNLGSAEVRPLAISPDGNRLFAVNTLDLRLKGFHIGFGGIAR